MRILICMVPLMLITSLASAETPQQFVQRIEHAINQTDKQKRLKSLIGLYYLEGTDKKTRGFLKGILRMLDKRRGATITLLPISDEKFVHIIDGYEYRPNLEPVGLVKFEGGDDRGGSSQVPYGKKNGKYYLPGTIRKLVKANAPKDITLQMIAIGNASPALTFTGWCDVRYSDNKIRRRTISDEGRGNTTLAFHGQGFEHCEITNTAGRGSLSFRLIEADNTVFEGRVEFPQTVLEFNAGS